MSSKAAPKDNTSSFKKFEAYADSIGVDADDLSASTTAGCYRDELEAVRRGAVIHGVGSAYRRSSVRANHRNLRLAGVISDIHAGIRFENVNWSRFDYLLSLRERIN